MSLRIAVLGAGRHSRSAHGAALKLFARENSGRLELAAVCDLNPEAAQAYAAEYGFKKAYGDIDSLLKAEKIDGLLVVTPLALTAKIVEGLIPHGIPLLIEKPPGASSVETRRLLAEARTYNLPHMISFNRRFSPAVLKAAEWLEGAVSARKPDFILARMLRRNRREPNFAKDTGIHAVDTVLALMGKPLKVSASTSAGAPAHWEAALKFVSGTAGMIVMAPATGFHTETYEVFGPDYTVMIDADKGSVNVKDRGEEVLSWSVPPGSSPELVNGTVDETRAFVESLEGRRAWKPDLADGLFAMLTAECIQERRDAEIGDL